MSKKDEITDVIDINGQFFTHVNDTGCQDTGRAISDVHIFAPFKKKCNCTEGLGGI
jgi:hypothetical protein